MVEAPNGPYMGVNMAESLRFMIVRYAFCKFLCIWPPALADACDRETLLERAFLKVTAIGSGAPQVEPMPIAWRWRFIEWLGDQAGTIDSNR